MNIDWGAYPSFLGHSDTPGCFRCHTRDLQDDEGHWISDDCTLCHSILAYGEIDAIRLSRTGAGKGAETGPCTST